jgi:hypothetical protein
VSGPTPSPALADKDVNKLKQLTGTLLYYARAVDPTLIMPINVLASEQSKATEVTADKTIKLLNYCNTNPETKIRYHASEMILHIHSDASYLSENEAESRAGGFFYMGNATKNDKKLTNGAILIVSKVLKHVMSSAAEQKLEQSSLTQRKELSSGQQWRNWGTNSPPQQRKQIIPLPQDTATGSGETRTISNLLGPRISKFGGLFHKTSFASASQTNTQRIHSRRMTTDKSGRNSGFRIARVC